MILHIHVVGGSFYFLKFDELSSFFRVEFMWYSEYIVV